MNNPIIMHINYCEQGQSLERVCHVASALGYDGVEFRRFKEIYGLDQKAYLETVAELKDRFGLSFTLFGGPELITHDDRASRCEEEYFRFLEIADSLRLLSTVNMMTAKSEAPDVPVDLQHCDAHGYTVKDEAVWERSVSACRRIADAYPHVRFAFETHMFYVHDTAASARKLADAIDRPNFGINLDYGNALFYAKTEPLEEAIDIAGDRLFYTHFKSYQPLGLGTGLLLPTSLADGCINHRRYAEKLKEVGFKGPIGIEAPRPGDREHFAAEDIAYIKPLIRDT
ncbi:MAG: sugar phosphate isomerase/epimerase [Lachnospiraceae bacterium]|nr:sugar phosphate isomerase/epimerase [Lachnospiraceae bacterium]